jgi:poly(A) polymerase
VFPLTEISLSQEQDGFPLALIPRALANTDTRINNNKPVTPAFLLAVMLWYPMKQKTEQMVADGMSWHEASQFAGQWVIQQQSKATSVPRRFSTPMREIWNLQSRLERRAGKRAFRMLEHPRFRAAYDFLVLRADIGEVEQELADWWTVFQEVDEAEQRSMVSKLTGGSKKKGRRRRRKADG